MFVDEFDTLEVALIAAHIVDLFLVSFCVDSVFTFSRSFGTLFLVSSPDEVATGILVMAMVVVGGASCSAFIVFVVLDSCVVGSITVNTSVDGFTS